MVNELGCVDSITKAANIRVIQPPIADFTPSDSNHCIPVVIGFTDASTYFNPPGGWNWTFGDGGSSISQNPNNTYFSTGTWTVTFITTDVFGCSDTISKDVVMNPPPVADFINDDSLGCLIFPVNFTGLTPGIVTWDWDFGDGTSGAGSPTSHTYVGAGAYDVQLTVTDTSGCVDSIEKPALIVIDPPVAEFDPNTFVNCVDLDVLFTDATVSTYPIVSYEWGLWRWDHRLLGIQYCIAMLLRERIPFP